MPTYEEYREGKIISQRGRNISTVEELLDEADGDPVRTPTAKELRHLAQYSGYEQMTGDTTQPQVIAQQNDAWKLGLVLTVIAVVVLAALIVKVL